MICILILTTQINPTCSTHVLQSLQGYSHWIHFLFFSENIKRFIDYRVTDSKCYNGFSQINKSFKFSWINHISLVIMDSFSKCCEINTVILTYGSLQMLPWNNDFILEEMDGSKWCRHITATFFNICMPETKVYQHYYISPC